MRNALHSPAVPCFGRQPLGFAVAAALLAPGLALAAGTLDQQGLTGLNYLPDSYGGFGSPLVNAGGLALSADGLTVVGKTYVNSQLQPALFTASGVQLLPVASGTTQASATGVSADGQIIAGWAYIGSSYASALVWKDGVLTRLADLETGSGSLAPHQSQAWAVSADGLTLVGNSNRNPGGYASISQAVYWRYADGSWGAPQSLLGGRFTSGSSARAVSTDGAVIVGFGGTEVSQWNSAGSQLLHVSGYVSEAFRWTADGGMQGLGVLAAHDADVSGQPAGLTAQSAATGVSADGSVVTGYSVAASSDAYQAFRWTQSGGMSGLGMLAGGTYSKANAINADGSVIVGDADAPVVINGTPMSFNGGTAFRWSSSGGMQSIADWLTASGVTLGSNTFSSALAVDASGNVVMGSGLIDGITQTYLARVSSTGGGGDTGGGDTGGGDAGGGDTGGGDTGGGDTGGGDTGGGDAGGGDPVVDTGGDGVIGLTTFQNTLRSVGSLTGSSTAFMQMTMFGAHHRPLADDGLAGGNCLWATADRGRDRERDSRQHLEEVGACTDAGALRLGLGVGNSAVDQDLAYGGEGRFRGQYLLAEADYRLAGGLLASLTGMYGRWDVDIDRAYLNGGAVDVSHGSSDATLWALRGRLDWLDLLTLGQASLSPFVAYTWSHSQVDGYSESGGGFPVRFDSIDGNARELRAGLSLKQPLAQGVELRLTGEAVHRFDEKSAAVGYSLLNTGLSGRAAGAAVDQDWLRAGAELDWVLTENTRLATSLHAASAGEDADVSGSVGIRLSF